MAGRLEEEWFIRSRDLANLGKPYPRNGEKAVSHLGYANQANFGRSTNDDEILTTPADSQQTRPTRTPYTMVSVSSSVSFSLGRSKDWISCSKLNGVETTDVEDFVLGYSCRWIS
jgi:hypothetical protein